MAEHSAHMTQSLKTLLSIFVVVVVEEKPFHIKPLCEISCLSVIASVVFQLETGTSQPNLLSLDKMANF